MLTCRISKPLAPIRWLCPLLAAAWFVSGCDGGNDRPPREDSDSGALEPGEEADGAAPAQRDDETETAQRPALCDRPADDAVRDIFCKSENPTVTGLRELLLRLDIPALPVDMDEASAAEIRLEPTEIVEHLVVLGHSTALSGNLVSPINPRTISMSKSSFVAYQRGVQKAEIATRDRISERLNFYLLTFTQACNEREGGCRPGDLYTPDVERDWRSVSLQDDEELKNTPLDCRQCHMRKLSKPQLLMRELFGPWPHFFFPDIPDIPGKDQLGVQLLHDFLSAKGDESYGGMPSAYLRQTVGLTLQKRIDQTQPLQFDPKIPLQIEGVRAAGTGTRSSLWDQQFDNFKRGEILALPYFEQKATDPEKENQLADAYARYRRGELSKDDLPDLGAIHPDDPQTRAEMGLQTEPNATPAEALIQACGQCHNDVLDQTISRARFSVAIKRLPRSEIELAIQRIELPLDHEEAMPPKGMRQLDPGAKARLIEYLRQEQFSEEDDAKLEHAATVGMSRVSYYNGS